MSSIDSTCRTRAALMQYANTAGTATCLLHAGTASNYAAAATRACTGMQVSRARAHVHRILLMFV